MDRPVTVVETKTFLTKAASLLTADEKDAMLWHLAMNPGAGDLMPDTGGARKLRWAVGGRGKSGGVRVIYFFHGERMPLFLFTVYQKGRKNDLSQAERNALRETIKAIARDYLRRK